MAMTVVILPPAFRDYPIDHELWNDRLEELRDAVLDLADTYGLEVADLWHESWQHPDPPSLFPDGLHFSEPGQLMAAQVIRDAVHRSASQLP